MNERERAAYAELFAEWRRLQWKAFADVLKYRIRVDPAVPGETGDCSQVETYWHAGSKGGKTKP